MMLAKRVVRRLFILLAGCLLLFHPLDAVSGPMPSFVLPELGGAKMVNSEEFQGKALVVVFFSVYCPPCVAEMPSLVQLQKKYGEKGFAVVGICLDQAMDDIVKRVVEKKGVNYQILMGGKKVADDFGGVAKIPTAFLINASGNVVKRYPGILPSIDEIDAALP